MPGLKPGGAPDADMVQLESELHSVINKILHGDFFSRYGAPSGSRVIRDIAISGNGEPTTCRQFNQVIELVGRVIDESDLPKTTRVTLITNGSLMHLPLVQKGIRLLGEMKGEIWFKLDSVTTSGIRTINHARIPKNSLMQNLETAARLCTTWIQTCVFTVDGKPPSLEEQRDYIKYISALQAEGVPLSGIYLYGIARPSMQEEAPRLGRLPDEWLARYAEKIEETGLPVRVNV
ncbi:MAG TPA: radical SAM protein [Gammaproteobacteria bacterium]|nr:radical SAM protein [Gammaproteobacteria bacterium]